MTPDFDFAKELVPVAVVATGDMVIITGTRTPLPNLKELVAKAKAQKLFMASSGTGSTGEIVLLTWQARPDVKMELVQYKSPPEALIDLVGGRVDVFTTSTTTYLASDAANKTTPVAVSSRSRAKKLPNVPTATEAGFPDVVVEPWWGLMAPDKTPPEILEQAESGRECGDGQAGSCRIPGEKRQQAGKDEREGIDRLCRRRHQQGEATHREAGSLRQVTT